MHPHPAVRLIRSCVTSHGTVVSRGVQFLAGSPLEEGHHELNPDGHWPGRQRNSRSCIRPPVGRCLYGSQPRRGPVDRMNRAKTHMPSSFICAAIVAVFYILCGSPFEVAAGADEPRAAKPAQTLEIRAATSAVALRRHVEYLASSELEGR